MRHHRVARAPRDFGCGFDRAASCCPSGSHCHREAPARHRSKPIDCFEHPRASIRILRRKDFETQRDLPPQLVQTSQQGFCRLIAADVFDHQAFPFGRLPAPTYYWDVLRIGVVAQAAFPNLTQSSLPTNPKGYLDLSGNATDSRSDISAPAATRGEGRVIAPLQPMEPGRQEPDPASGLAEPRNLDFTSRSAHFLT